MFWDYIQPVKIKFGNGRVNEISKIVLDSKYKKGLLVCSNFFVRNGFADELIRKNERLIQYIFSEVSPNPDVKEVDKCAEVIRKKEIDFIVALGGGSVIDCAKAASSICFTNDSIRKYHGTGVKMLEKHIPIIAIPTTAGTGSEVTCVSVLTDHECGKKAPIVSNGFYPEYAIIDPKLTFTMPPHITAGTGIDVLSHAIEGYWSKNHQPICDSLAIYAADIVFKFLYKAYKDPNDEIAREKMAEASVIAGLAFTLPKTTAPHACSFPLTNIYEIPHGEACGLTLDYFTRINAKYDEDGRMLLLTNKLGFRDAYEMAEEIHKLKGKMSLRNDLKDLNLNDEKIEELVRISRHPNLYNNPVDITDEMLKKMYESFR